MKKAMLAFSAVGLFLLLMVVAGCSDHDSAAKTVTPPTITDTTPDAFTFVDQTGIALSTLVTSAPAITVAGINSATPISVSGGQYSINGGAYTDVDGTVANTDTVTVQHTSAAVSATATDTTLTIGGVSDIFTSTTAPFAFAFVDQTGTDVDPALITSAPVIIAGLAADAAISIDAASAAGSLYAINGGAFTALAGTVANGDSVTVQHPAAVGPDTATDTILTIGTTSDTFTSTTVSIAAATAVYNANCAGCHFLGAGIIDPETGTETGPDLDGASVLLDPIGPPLVIPTIPGHPVINLTTTEIFSLAFLFDNL